jgi:hypothetical protein
MNFKVAHKAKYEAGLGRARGNLTLWVTDEAVANWSCPAAVPSISPRRATAMSLRLQQKDSRAGKTRLVMVTGRSRKPPWYGTRRPDLLLVTMPIKSHPASKATLESSIEYRSAPRHR